MNKMIIITEKRTAAATKTGYICVNQYLPVLDIVTYLEKTCKNEHSKLELGTKHEVKSI